MKYFIFIACLTISGFSLAQEKSLSLAKRLYVALDTQSQIDAMAVNLQNITKQQMASVKIPEKARPFIEQKYSEIYALLFNSFKSEEIQQKYIESFAKTYTERELEQVVEFFESPAGKAYIAKAPQLQKSQLAIAQAQVAAINPAIQKIQQQITAELSKYE
ncbi:MAG: DUF2059 domain-containing protein [Neptuniibacter sp.]